MGAQIIFPQRGVALGHVTPKIFGIWLKISSKLLELETSNLVHSFVFGKPSGRGKNFPEKGRVVVTWPLKYLAYDGIIKFGNKTAKKTY